MIKNKKPTIKPISTAQQISSLEYHINKRKQNTSTFKYFVELPIGIAEAILVTLKRLPKGVD